MFSIYSFTASPTFQTVWDVHIKKSSFWGKWGQSLHYFAFFRWVTTILGWSGKIQIVKSTFLAITFEDCSCSRFCLLPGWYQTDPPDISNQNLQARKFGAKVFWCFWKMETKEQRTFFFFTVVQNIKKMILSIPGPLKRLNLYIKKRSSKTLSYNFLTGLCL